jgi:hypothetical protein
MKGYHAQKPHIFFLLFRTGLLIILSEVPKGMAYEEAIRALDQNGDQHLAVGYHDN